MAGRTTRRRWRGCLPRCGPIRPTASILPLCAARPWRWLAARPRPSTQRAWRWRPVRGRCICMRDGTASRLCRSAGHAGFRVPTTITVPCRMRSAGSRRCDSNSPARPRRWTRLPARRRFPISICTCPRLGFRRGWRVGRSWPKPSTGRYIATSPSPAPDISRTPTLGRNWRGSRSTSCSGAIATPRRQVRRTTTSAPIPIWARAMNIWKTPQASPRSWAISTSTTQQASSVSACRSGMCPA